MKRIRYAVGIAGLALAAAGTVLPAAQASATPSPAATSIRTVTAGSHADSPRPLAVTPDIRVAACTSARANWVHITFTSPVANTICYGGTGRVTFGANKVSKFCPGNNDGAFTWMDIATGQDHTYNFEPGNATIHYNPQVDAVSLTIDSFSGNHPC
jgi:hypothetical protein